ncbi:MAG: translocation/assembly module TamB domain-containing protein [Bacteroidetes bacterium]|nr:translocation/assembly module TamB domain-containing protein [Bacteroidota bacterium]
MAQQLVKRSFRILTNLLLFVVGLYLVLFVAVFILLQSDAVQNWLLPKITSSLSEALGTEVKLERISVRPFSWLSAEGFEMKDDRGERLFAARSISVNMFDVPSLAWLSGKEKLKQIQLGAVQIDQPFARLCTRSDSTSNLAFLSSEDTTDRKAHHIALSIDQLAINGGEFIRIDSTRGAEGLRLRPGHLNYSNLHFRKIDLKAGIRFTRHEDLLLDVLHLSTEDRRTGVVLDTLRSNIIVALTHEWAPKRLRDELPEAPYVQLKETRICIGRSRLFFDLLMERQTLETLFASGQNRRYNIFFHPSELDFSTINHFIPQSEVPLKGVLKISGPVRGDYRSIRGKGLNLAYGSGTQLSGSLSVRNFTDPDALFLEANLDHAQLVSSDLQTLLPGIQLPQELTRVGWAQANGRFTGFLNDFVADAQIHLPIGDVQTNLNIKEGADGLLYYKGQLSTRDLNLDSLLGRRMARRLNMEASVEGNRAELAELKIKGSFRMWDSEVGGYHIDSVSGKADIHEQIVEASLRLKDTHGDFNGYVVLDLGKEIPTYKLYGDVANADLQHYRVIDQPVLLTTIFNVDISGDSLDNLQGTVRFFQFNLLDTLEQRRLSVNNLVASSQGNAHYKELNVRAAPADLRITGNFSYAQLPTLFVRLAEDTRHLLDNDTLKLKSYFAQKPAVTDSSAFQFQFTAKDPDPLLQFFNTGFFMANGTQVSGRFSFGALETGSVQFSSKRLAYEAYVMEEIEGNFSLKKNARQPDLQASGQITTSNLRIPGGISFQHVNLTPSWKKDRIAFNVNAIQEGIRNVYLLSGALHLQSGRMELKLDADNSRILIGDAIWSFSPGNRIRFGGNRLVIENFSLFEGEQRIAVATGFLAHLEQTDLSVQLQKVNLSLVKHFLQSKTPISGIIDARLVAKDIMRDPKLSWGGTIQDFKYRNITYGDFSADSYWTQDLSRMYVQAQLVYQKDSVLALDGYLAPKADHTDLYFKLSTRNLRLNRLQPFLDKYVKKLDGQFSVKDMLITGTVEQPIMRGTAELQNATAEVVYLGTQYFIRKERIQFSQDRILLDTAAVYMYQPGPDPRYDARAAQCRLQGHISLKDLDNPYLDLMLDNFQRFQVFDLRAHENSAFYGKAFIKNGSASLRGPANHLMLTANVTPEKGTDVFIPADEGAEEQRLDFVRFIGATQETDTLAAAEPSVTFEMELNLNVTPDARISLVFDEKTGDVISGRGQGTLRLALNRQDEFLMYGSVTMTEGNYLFTYGNVTAKPFLVDPGGRISWDGDPYDGQLNLNAVYRVENASLAAWDTTAATSRVDVLMTLQGSVERPDIQFGIRIPNISQQQTFRIVSTLNFVRNDVQELNRQVFSLILMHRVAPVGGFFVAEANGGGGNLVTTSVSEFLSTQMTSWLSNSLGNEIDINLVLNQDGTLGANASARLFNDKVTIRRNGALAGNAQRDVSLGNISIEIKLYPGDSTRKENPGRLGVEIFNRENLVTNALASTNRGAGIFYRKDFDRLTEILGGKKSGTEAIRPRNKYFETEQPDKSGAEPEPPTEEYPEPVPR